jgi:protein phosphatase 2C
MEDKWAAVPNLIQVPAAFASPPANTGPGANHSAGATFAAASCGCIKRSSKEPKDKDGNTAKSLEATPLRSAAAAGVPGSNALGSSSNCDEDMESLHYFAVFDGHGGAEAAKFCAAKMHSVVEAEIAGLLRGEGAATDNVSVWAWVGGRVGGWVGDCKGSSRTAPAPAAAAASWQILCVSLPCKRPALHCLAKMCVLLEQGCCMHLGL